MDDQQIPIPLRIKLFGDIDVQVNGAPLPKLRSRKELWLLALLALQQGRSVARAWLAQTLWPFPDHAADQAAYNLRRCLTNLRKALGAEASRIRPSSSSALYLDIENAEVDVGVFDRCVSQQNIASLQTSVSLYSGPLLIECTEPWAVAERGIREQNYLRALRLLGAYAVTGGDYESAIAYLKRAVAVDPLSESARRDLMETLARCGDIPAALQVYQEFSRLLHHQRNACPGAETTSLYHALRTELRRNEKGRANLAAPSSPPLYRLPVPLTALIGRKEEIKEIETRFRLQRLLTLTGAGGVGKTRLAIQLTEELAPEFRDGVCFVDLSAVTDPSHIGQITAAALDATEDPGVPTVETLLNFLRSRQLLLILDNCEHLVDACARLAQSLLTGCRFLRILATSRQSLGVAGESVWRVASLALPDPAHLPPDNAELVTNLEQYSAIQLFVERAVQTESAFCLTPQNANAVVAVCRRLDGIPLALELAAARVKALSVEQIAERLGNRFRLLTIGSRTALSRQQTLEAAMKWSFDLLEENDRELLFALSVFAGGWTLEAAEQMGAALEMPGGSVLDRLTRLVDRSLVIFETTGEQVRYRLMETMRQYCRENQRSAVAARRAAENHLNIFLRLTEHAARYLQGVNQAVWFNQLEREHENIRVALEWSLTQPDCAETSMRMAAALWRFWHRRGYLSLGRRYLANALEQGSNSGSTRSRAEALIGAGMLAFFQGDCEAARLCFEQSLAIGAERREESLRANALHSLGQMRWNQGDYRQAHALFTEVLAIQRRQNDAVQIAATLNYLGVIAGDDGDQAAAQVFLEESLAISRELNDRRLIANALNSLAHTAFYREDYAEARNYYTEQLKLAQNLQDKELTARTLHRLGCVEQEIKNYNEARRLFEESLFIAEEIFYRDLESATLLSLGAAACAQADFVSARVCFERRLALNEERGDLLGISYTLDAFAAMLVAQQQEKRAVTLYSAAQALREPLTPASTANQSEAPRLLAARDFLKEDSFVQAWENGRTMLVEEAADFARAVQA